MEPQTEHETPRILDTYGLVYAFTALMFIPALFVVDRFSVEPFSPAYLALLAMPFLLGPAVVFALDSTDGARTVAIRSAVLAPLVAFTGVTILFVAMLLVLPVLSLFLSPDNFRVIAVVMAVTVVVLASPMVLSLVNRFREGLSPAGVVQVTALVAVLGVIAWMIVMTFDPGDTLGTFLGKDIVDHFIGAFTWYLPAFALAGGIWRRTGIV